ncbi:VIR protein [Plasmodium vivax]|uniref:VIR protein n=1 Tax=Plasmodium vivax TaxID=5855 RepID=A0A1G4E2M6_PLAVI|nr:VIR protein [Plasmodium vivax]
MSKNITDIEYWKDDYPFLNEVWTTYNGFNKDVVDDEDKSKYSVLCKQIIEGSKMDLSIHTQICMKLMRNLGYFSLDPEYYQLSRERCNILYNWIYNLINKKKITDKVIDKCFEMYDFEMKSKRNDKKCYHYRDIKLYEPINITLLDIFNDKMPIIKTTLKDVNIPNRVRGRNYVCECLKIYKLMNDKYCSKGKEKTADNLSTCIKLGNFKDSYKLYLYDESDFRTIIPSLDNLDEDLLVKCSDKEEKLQLVSIGLGTPEGYQEHSSTEDVEGAKPYLGMDTTLGNEDSPMRKTITTTIGTFAGASSLLALLYKFTPAGRLVNPKLRTTGIINNNLYSDDANGMLFNGNEHDGFNSYNIGYEAA